jgi:hypothetical protein
MVQVWSELRAARTREQVADAATVSWLSVWGVVAWQAYRALADFAESGRLIRSGGTTMIDSGVRLGDALAGIPLVGPGLRDVARNAFAGAGGPLADFGTDVEGFILLVAAILALLLVLVTFVPWLSRYLPWRWERLRTLRAAHRAIRRTLDVAPGVAPDVEPDVALSVAPGVAPDVAPNVALSVAPAALAEVLALRAVTRLDYATLLEHTPDPLGDWVAGRHDRLARAELASVGLRG